MSAVDIDPEGATNPLVAGLERQPVRSTAVVIFGAMGDLASRKLLPGIYNLAHEGALPERIALIGVSRSKMTDEEFRAQARESIDRFSRRRPGPRRARTGCSRTSSTSRDRSTMRISTRGSRRRWVLWMRAWARR